MRPKVYPKLAPVLAAVLVAACGPAPEGTPGTEPVPTGAPSLSAPSPTGAPSLSAPSPTLLAATAPLAAPTAQTTPAQTATAPAEALDLSTTLTAPAGGVDTPTLSAFEVTPLPLERGASVTFRWAVAGAVSVHLWPQTYDRKTGQWYRVPAGVTHEGWPSPLITGPSAGEHSVFVALDSRTPFRLEVEALDSTGRPHPVHTTEPLTFHCYPSLLGDEVSCPLAARSVPAVYQRFEHGVLIWLSDTGAVYLLSENPGIFVPWRRLTPASDVANVGLPPGGQVAPGPHLVAAWATVPVNVSVVRAGTPEAANVLVSDILGWGTGPEQAYTAQTQFDLLPPAASIRPDQFRLTVPDGRVAVLSLYDGLAATAGPNWWLAEP